MPLEVNALESKRFGITAARATDLKMPPEAMNAAAAALGVEMLILRLDCADHARIHTLEDDGHRLMDTLVYYARPLATAPNPPPANPGLKLRRASPEDAGEVAEVARAAFRGYIGHYHADPRLDQDAADAAYVEWAETSISQTGDNTPALLALIGERIMGFLTLRRNTPREWEIVLNAVNPQAQGRGIYSHLLAAAVDHARTHVPNSLKGRFIVSTQLNNYRIQQAWARQGFRLYLCLHTFHKWYDSARRTD